MKLDTRVVKKLEQILEEEYALYVEYLAVLAQERACVIALKADQVNVLSSRRAELINQLSTLRDERAALVEEQSNGESRRLSDIVEQSCAPADKKKLLMLIGKIKNSLAMVEEKSREFSHVLGFTLGLVNGEISLLWSASQPVTRVYDSFGSLNEARQPTAPRAGSLLGQA
jgi:hypothetical protein